MYCSEYTSFKNLLLYIHQINKHTHTHKEENTMYFNLPDGITMDDIERYMGDDEAEDPLEIIKRIADFFKKEGKTEVTVEDVIWYCDNNRGELDFLEDYMKWDDYAVELYDEFRKGNQDAWVECLKCAVESINYYM